jgi:Uncharacterized protein conserved in bacteria
VVAIITMHEATAVRRETGEQAKMLNKMEEQWMEVTENNNPVQQNMHMKEMVAHTPYKDMADFAGGILVGVPVSYGPLSAPCQNVRSTCIYELALAGGKSSSAQRFAKAVTVCRPRSFAQKSANFLRITYQRPAAIWHPIWVLWS